MTSPGTAQPTDNERETAWRLLHSGGLDSFRADVIAQHLADQRARYENALAEVEDLAAGLSPCNDFWRGNIDGLNNAVRLIRQEVG